MRVRRMAAACVLAGLLPGCPPVRCPDTFVPLSRLVAEHNANADAVPRLWARATLSVTLAPEGHSEFTWRSGSPTCLLLLAKGPDPLGPHDFCLLGRETAAVELFRLGVSTAQGLYYFWYRFGDNAGAFHGRIALAGAPGMGHVPLDPMQLLSVLGVTALPADQTAVPAALLDMHNERGDCAYVVTCIDRQPVTGRILRKREMFFRWSKDGPRRCYRVDLFDPAGRRAMTARLADYQPIDVSRLDDPPAVQPVMPTDIEVTWNDQPGLRTFVKRIHIGLSEMTAEDKWDRSACAFRPPTGVSAESVDRLPPRPASPPASQPASRTTSGPATGGPAK